MAPKSGRHAQPTTDLGRPSRRAVRERHRHSAYRSPLSALPGVIVGAVFACAIVGAQLLNPAEVPPTPAPSPGQADQFGQAAPVDPRDAVVAGAQSLLDRRAAAVLNRDESGWLTGFAHPEGDLANQQRRVFANFADVPFAAWSYVVGDVGSVGEVPADKVADYGVDKAWVVPTVLSYEFADEDGKPLPGLTPIKRQRTFTVAQQGDIWTIVGTSEGTSSTDLWDISPVVVVRGSRSIVLGAEGGTKLTPLATDADRAAARVDDVWGTNWPRTSVILVPKTQDDMSRLLGRTSSEGLDQVAAVTTGATDRSGTGAQTTGDRVIVNPKGYDDLGTVGRLIVLTHELTHVATRVESTTTIPMWVSEGFADYVGYHAADIAKPRIVASAVEAFRKGQLGDALPSADSFNPAKGDIGPAYSGSWLVMDVIAEKYGQDRLVQFYREASHAPEGQEELPPDQQETRVDEVMQRVLGVGAQQVAAQWKEALAAYAG